MAKRVSFDETTLIEKLFEQLRPDGTGENGCPFRDWEILHELDRQAKRKEYDKSPERIKRRRERDAERERVRKYIEEHPKEVAHLRSKVLKEVGSAR